MMKYQKDIKDLCKKLKPVIGEKAGLLWNMYLAEDERGRRDLALEIEIIAEKVLNKRPLENEKILLEPVHVVAGVCWGEARSAVCVPGCWVPACCACLGALWCFACCFCVPVVLPWCLLAWGAGCVLPWRLACVACALLLPLPALPAVPRPLLALLPLVCSSPPPLRSSPRSLW